METKPSFAQLRALDAFLEKCERAAVPPPPHPPPNALSGFGLLGNLFAPPSSTWNALGGVQYPSSLEEVLGEPAPFTASEKLPSDRSDRIALLRAWLARYPGFAYVKSEMNVKAAFATFKHRQKQSASGPKLTDDIADFRFWGVAVKAIMFADYRPEPPPSAKDRQSAVRQAKLLRSIAEGTTLLTLAGLDWRQGKAFMEALSKVEGVEGVKKRTRYDDQFPDRAYVRLLSEFSLWAFDEASPQLICHLAGLKLKSPDLTAITKLVAGKKRERLLEQRRRLAAELHDPGTS